MENSINPFLGWIDTRREFAPKKIIINDIVQGFYIPSDKSLKSIYKLLHLDEDKLNNIRLSSKLSYTFTYLWDSRNFDKVGITIENNKLIQYEGTTKISIPIVSQIETTNYNIIYIDGFLSLPHLTKIIKNMYLSPNFNNPFLKFKGQIFYPDISIVQSIFDEFKVSNIDELLPYQSDYKSIFPCHSYNVLKCCCSKEEMIPVIDIISNDINFIERLPIDVMKRLRQLIENRKNAKSDISNLSKDILSLIIVSNITGQDLINLCIADRKINEKCYSNNQQIFRQALKSEFNIEFYKGLYDYENAKDMYIQVHKFSLILTYDDNKLDSIGITNKYHISKLYNYQTIFVPTILFSSKRDELQFGFTINFHADRSLVFIYAEDYNNVPIISNHKFKNLINNDAYFKLMIQTIKLTRDHGSDTDTIEIAGLKELGFSSNLVDYSTDCMI